MKINWLDILILLPLLLGLVRGLMRGLVSEVIAIAVVILGILGSRMVAPPFSTWLVGQFAWPAEVCGVVAYVLVFLLIGIVLSIVAKLLSKFLKAIHLGWVNRLLGGLFGLCKFGLIVLVFVFAIDKANTYFHWFDEAEIVKSSVVYPYAVQAVHWIEAHL